MRSWITIEAGLADYIPCLFNLLPNPAMTYPVQLLSFCDRVFLRETADMPSISNPVCILFGPAFRFRYMHLLL